MEQDSNQQPTGADPRIAEERMRLTRYVLGEMDAAERADIERQAAADPRQASMLQQIRATWNAMPSTSEPQAPADSDAALAVVFARIDSGSQMTARDRRQAPG